MRKIAKTKIILFGVVCIMIGYFIAMTQDLTIFAGDIYKESTKELEHSQFNKVYKEVIPAVVNISTESVVKNRDPFYDMFREFFGDNGQRKPQYRENKETHLGSGFIINEDGYIVTNNHVVERADTIKVKLSDGEEYPAEVVGTDKRMDVAIIKINVKKKLPFIVLGDSDKIEVGDWSLAIGNPFGLERTLTVGVVSAKGRPVRNSTDALIQTDTAINPGNSGGPLLNINGEVVGINTMIAGGEAQNIGFAIPINSVKKVIIQLVKYGKVEQAYLGVEMENVDVQMKEDLGLSRDTGVLVRRVLEKTPAEKAGIEVGDIIFEVDGKTVKNADDLAAIIAYTPAETTVKIKLLRKGKEKIIPVTLAVRKDDGMLAKRDKTGEARVDSIGISVANTDSGVEIASVSEDSPAYGILQEGDIIISVNNVIIGKAKDFTATLEELKNKRMLYFLIKRDGRQVWLQVRNK